MNFSYRGILITAIALTGFAVIAALVTFPTESRQVLRRSGLSVATDRLSDDVADLKAAAAPLLARFGAAEGEAAEETADPAAENEDRSAAAASASGAAARGRAESATAAGSRSSAPIVFESEPPAPSPGFVAGYVQRDEPIPVQPAPSSSDDGVVYSESDADVTPPRPLQPLLPRNVTPTADGSRVGTAEFVVDQKGDVESVRMVQRSGSVQEGMLIAAIKGWRFEPARRNGIAVRYRQTIRVTY